MDILNNSEIAMEMVQIDLFSQQLFFAANLGVCNKTSRKAHEQSSFFQIMQLVSCSPMLHELEETALGRLKRQRTAEFEASFEIMSKEMREEYLQKLQKT